MILYGHTVMVIQSHPLDFSRPVPIGDLSAMVGLVDFSLQAGFPSPAEDMHVPRVELMQLLDSHPQSTFMVRIRGSSMEGAGIFDGDIVAVNKALDPKHNDIVVAIVDNEFTCKRLFKRGDRIRLMTANPAYPDIRPKEGQTIEVWGVVVASLKLFRRPGR